MAGLTLKAHTLGVALGETVQFSGDANADGLMGLAQGVRGLRFFPATFD